MTRPRVVIAGLGDSGLLSAIHLSRRADVVGVSTKPGLVSGQELGMRLARPDEWSRSYWTAFDRYRRLDGVRTVHATLTGVDLDARTVTLTDRTGSRSEPYDALVISTGVSNGFWRTPHLEDEVDVAAGVHAQHARLAAARSIVVIGAGAAAVSTAANVAARWPHTTVGLYFPGERALPQHHRRTWSTVRRRLLRAGVHLHPGHRAVIPTGFGCDRITVEPVEWSTGQAPVTADAVVWAVGRVVPNTAWLPPHLLDARGFVRVTEHLTVPGHDDVFAVGDVAATDPMRGSARNRADRVIAHNVTAADAGRPMRSYRPRRHRWGSVLGVQPDGLQVFAPNGIATRVPRWATDRVLQPWIVQRGIYHGVRPSPPATEAQR